MRTLEYLTPPIAMSQASKTRGYEMNRPRLRVALVGVLLATVTACSSLEINRDTETSGTFKSSARTWVFLGWHMPRPAIQIAHENISDSGLPNVRETEVHRTDWGWFNWIIEIFSTRTAYVKGTWGYSGAEIPPDR